MKSVRNLSLLTLALAASLPAFATYCADGSTIESHPNGNCNYNPPKNDGDKGGSTNNGGGGGGGGAGVGVGVGIAGAASSAAADASAKSNSVANATGTGGKASSSASGGNAAAIQGQQQGIAGSGNSTVKGGNTTGTVSGTQSMSNTGNSRATGGTASQGQGQSSRNTLSTSAGNGAGASAGAGAGSGNRTSNTTNLDASDRSSSRDRTTVWANPVLHGAGAAALPSANIAIVPGVCGPRVMVVSRPVVGREAHMMSDASTFDHTTTDRVVALTDGNGIPVAPFEERGGYLIGHQITIMAAVVGTSTAASLSLGGFLASGGGAQGGVAASGQLQQLVKSVEVAECVYTPPVIIEYRDRDVIREVPAKRVRQ